MIRFLLGTVAGATLVLASAVHAQGLESIRTAHHLNDRS